jgi:superfamily II DNA/RNA helicase
MHAEDYVHRIGRTGRAERSGKAVTLVTPLDERRAAEIERLLGYEVNRVKLDGFTYDALERSPTRPRGRPHSGGSRGDRSGGRGKRGPRRHSSGSAKQRGPRGSKA